MQTAPANRGGCAGEVSEKDEHPSDTAAHRSSQGSQWRSHYKVHPAADVFPMMSDDELATLGEDIKANGLKTKIVVHDGLLLDGRNRLEAMQRAGILEGEGLTGDHRWSAFLDFYKDDPVAYIISLNIHRRHLTKQQQADLIVAAHKAAEKPRQVGEVSKGGRAKVNKVKAAAVETAKEHGISKRTVERAFERASDHPKAPTKPKSKSARPPAMGPRTVEGWRRGYINACKIGCPDLDAELETVRTAFKEIVGKRASDCKHFQPSDDPAADLREAASLVAVRTPHPKHGA